MSKKEKLLASAQKNLLKGQIGKAIKDYETIAEIDGRDIRNRQKLAELYSRAHMPDKALETYEAVAKHYEDNGFLLKALAVFKQMQKVDGNRPELYRRLAELNVKQGLIGNALSEYRNLVSLYRRQGDMASAVEVLDKMKGLDPDNLGIGLQVAEGFSLAGQEPQAVECLVELLQRVATNADARSLEKVQEVGLACCPASVPLKIALARGYLACGQTRRSSDLLQEVLQQEAASGEALQLLADSQHAAAEYVAEIDTYQRLLGADEENLDVRLGYARALLAARRAEQALAELEEFKPRFFAEGRAAALKDLYEQIKEQLPENAQALGSLQAIYEQTGEGGKLFDLMSARQDEEQEPEKDDTVGGEIAARETAAFGEVDLEIDEEQPPVAGADDGIGAFEVEAESAPPADAGGPAVGGGLEFDDLDLDGIEFGLDGADTPGDNSSSDFDDLGITDEPVRPTLNVAGELEEAEFYYQQGLLQEASQKCRFLLEKVGCCPQAEELLTRIASEGGAPPSAVSGRTPGRVADGSGASTAAGALQGLEDRERSRLDGAFNEFKKGLENQVSAEDTETHYNLGIAYKEMGLLDDAIGQFDKVMNDPERRIDCLTLKGVCLVQKGAFEEAVATFKAGLAEEALKDEERISLYYELGLLYVGWGQPLEALDSFQCVADVDPFFRNVDEQIRRLRQELGLDDDGGPSGNSSDKNRVSYI